MAFSFRDAFFAEPEHHHEAIALLVDLIDVDAEPLPRLMHPEPELGESFPAAIDRVDVWPDAGRMELHVGVEYLELGIEIVSIPSLVPSANHLGILRHRRGNGYPLASR